MKVTDFKLVKLGIDSVIFEGGYWMNRKDYDNLQELPDRKGIDVNKRTRQITWYFLPDRYEV